MDWWIENRRKSYYDMNSIDLAALINQLRVLGNESAELGAAFASLDPDLQAVLARLGRQPPRR